MPSHFTLDYNYIIYLTPLDKLTLISALLYQPKYVKRVWWLLNLFSRDPSTIDTIVENNYDYLYNQSRKLVCN